MSSVLLGFQDEEVKGKDIVDWSSNKFGGFPVSYVFFNKKLTNEIIRTVMVRKLVFIFFTDNLQKKEEGFYKFLKYLSTIIELDNKYKGYSSTEMPTVWKTTVAGGTDLLSSCQFSIPQNTLCIWLQRKRLLEQSRKV